MIKLLPPILILSIFSLIIICLVYYTDKPIRTREVTWEEKETEIPRIILQYTPNKDDLSPETINSINKLKSNNPNFEYYLFDDEDITSLDPYIKKTTPNIKNLLLNKYDGIYIDIEKINTTSLERFLSENIPTPEGVYTSMKN